MWDRSNVEKQTGNAKGLDQVDLRLEVKKPTVGHCASLSLGNSRGQNSSCGFLGVRTGVRMNGAKHVYNRHKQNRKHCQEIE